MNELSINQPDQPLVFAHNGEALANSLEVAEHFDKRHDNVVAAIRDLLKVKEISDKNFFTLTPYVDDGGRTYTSFNMNRDGFTVLVMGFIGERAMSFKLAYIAAFNAMEATLRVPAIASRQAPQAAAVVKQQPSGALVRGVQSLLVMLDTRMSHLSEAARQTMYASALKLINIEVPEPVVQKSYSTSELAQLFSMAPTTFGKLVKHLKVPGHGELRLTTAAHGKQVPQWHWTEAGRQAVMTFMGGGSLGLVDDSADDC